MSRAQGDRGFASFRVRRRLGREHVDPSIADHPFRLLLHEKEMVGPVTSQQYVEGRVSATNGVADVRRNLGPLATLNCPALQPRAPMTACGPARASAAA